MSEVKVAKKGISQGRQAALYFLAGIAWLVAAYILGDSWYVSSKWAETAAMGSLFLHAAAIVMAFLWVRKAERNPGPPTLTEAWLSLAYLLGIFLREWSDPHNDVIGQAYFAGWILGIIWFRRWIVPGLRPVRRRLADIVVLGIIFVLPMGFLYMFISKLSRTSSLTVHTAIYVVVFLLLLRAFLGALAKRDPATSLSFSRGVQARWLAFPLAVALVIGFGKSVRPLKIRIHSGWLLSLSANLPDGTYGKVDDFNKRDALYAKVGSIPIYGIAKSRGTVTFVTDTAFGGGTSAYFYAPDGKTPEAGEKQVVRKLWSDWWRVEPRFL